ncbi:MAG: hypothetical protein U9R20_02430 [Thermodesulfobacteriota bacterium]|nr:hypothetical protein [Thermodesulfobacteriota bacterium]
MDKKHKYKMFASRMREDLYRSLKLLSAVEDKPVQKLLEEAVTDYLDDREFQHTVSMVSEGGVRYSSVRKSDPKSKKDKSGK